ALEETSGRELGSWTKEWLQTSGVNTLRSAFEVDDNGCFTSFTVRQSADQDFPTLRRHRLAIGLYDLTDRALVRRSSTEIDVSGEDTDVPELLGTKRPDLVLLNDGDLTYAKVRLDDRSLATLVGNIDRFQDSLARALAWGAAWDMVRDAELRASDWVSLVLRGLAVETDQFAVRSLVARTGQAISQYTASANRAATAARWEAGLTELLQGAESGSDEQLAFARGLAQAAAEAGSLDLLAGLLDGSQTLDGLVVDTDLRWLILAGLAREGRAGNDAIDSELDRDNTISGQESAAAARAAMPTPQAKQQAWSQAVERGDVANETMRSIALSFNQPRQEEILRPYLEKYLETAETIWDERGVHHASTVLSHMFPREVATQATLDTTDGWLAASKGNPAARRLVSEGRDDVARALVAQEHDAQG
ncbi:MAG: ERAP1-like C-terminal domain-containing protein, partial [Actinomycetota bacterium]|nr:ERAP1-like C-terminal domain-containing protein [Actinomycetota bacterium]